MNSILLGPQGSGKGTQAELLHDRFGFVHIEVGDLLRHVAKTDLRIHEIVNIKGDLVPIQETVTLIEEKIIAEGGLEKGVIFDGFPRTVEQYPPLKEWLSEKGQKIDLAILIRINEEETIKRLSARRVCEHDGHAYNLITNPPTKEGVCNECGGRLIQRMDDQPETIKRRLALYHERTEPLLEQIRKDGILVEVDGMRKIEEIQNDLVEIVKEKLRINSNSK